MQMHTPKSSTMSYSEGSRKLSPRSTSSDTNQKSYARTTRQLKTTGLDTNSSSPSKPSVRVIKNTSPIISARKSPRSPVSELQKKHLGKVEELETQISELQTALNMIKDQLILSESSKDQAQLDAEESRKQLLVISSRLEESQKLLAQSSSAEPHGVHELESQPDAHDEAWKSKLEAAKKLHSADLDALATAMKEINQLQSELNRKLKSEATQTEQVESVNAELRNLKDSMSKTLSLVETMKTELKDRRSLESRAQALARDNLIQLETDEKTIACLEIERKVMVLEPEKEHEIEKEDEEEIMALKSEVRKLKSEVETAETRFNEERSRRTMEITSAYELVEEIKFNSRVKETELEEELWKSKADIEELKANLMDKETELQGICEENDDLTSKLKNSLSGKRENKLEIEIESLKQDFELLKSKLTVTETELHEKSDENEKLKLEIKKLDCKEWLGTGSESSDHKVDRLVEEIEKSNGKVARVVEQLEAAQTANYEMETELRKLKVQSDQWRKAAEAAAAMISTVGNNTNRKLMERTGSMDNCSPGRNVGSYGEDIEDEFLKKKNGNVLKRIGVLWKKPQDKRP